MNIKSSILDINNRLYYHSFFWLTYYSYKVLLYGDIKNTYENVAYVQALEIIVKMAVVYFTLYFLKPRFFNTEKYLYFAISMVMTILLATFLQMFVIRFCMEIGIYKPYPGSTFPSIKRFFSVMGHINWIVIVTFIIKVVKDAYQNIQINSTLQKEKLETELQFLKSQVNPHFFFNTLNNLYALTLRKSEEASEVVLKLSDLMAYMIYEAKNDAVLLSEELKYLNNYIELEKLRYGNYLSVNINIQGTIGSQKVAPLIFIPFIENAFKHGVAKGAKNNTIKIDFLISQNEIEFTCQNDIKKKKEDSNNGGIGLINVKRRLELLYLNTHNLAISESKDVYKVHLKLHLE